MTNNKFGRDFRFGIMVGTPTAFTGNVWEDIGEPVDPKATTKSLDK